jgi:predicted metal-dependent hydrolase
MKYLIGYSEEIKRQVGMLVSQDRLSGVLLQKYAAVHDIRTDKALYGYVSDMKNSFLRNAQTPSKVLFDNDIRAIQRALGLHTAISRVQGGKLKAKNEIRIASLFKEVPIEFLRMIVVHELAHLKEKDHNKAFYKLCISMEPSYHQIEFDLRLYLTHVDLIGKLEWAGKS